MKTLCHVLTALLWLGGQGWARDWEIIASGLSPNQKLGVAIFPQKTEFVDEADDTVLLIDAVKMRRIGPLEEVSSSGGTWGNTSANVHCTWSPDSTILIINFRTGRLMHSSQIYRIQGRRAIPLIVPADTTHPKSLILRGLGSTANPGSEITLEKDGSILERRWGYRPDFSVDYSKHGLAGFEGNLVFHYIFEGKGRLQLRDITVSPP